MSKDKEPKIIQIIPAVGWYAIFNEENPNENKKPVVCWALKDDGDVGGQVSIEAYLENAEDINNFSKYIHESELKSCE